MRYRSPSSFDSWDEFNDYHDEQSERYEGECQAADDACSEPDE